MSPPLQKLQELENACFIVVFCMQELCKNRVITGQARLGARGGGVKTARTVISYCVTTYGELKSVLAEAITGDY